MRDGRCHFCPSFRLFLGCVQGLVCPGATRALSRQAVDVANDHMESMWQMVESHGSRLRLRRSGLGHGVYRGRRFPVSMAWNCAKDREAGHEGNGTADSYPLSTFSVPLCVVLTRTATSTSARHRVHDRSCATLIQLYNTPHPTAGYPICCSHSQLRIRRLYSL